MDFATTDPPAPAAAMIAARERRPGVRPVPRHGATKAARQLATILTKDSR